MVWVQVGIAVLADEPLQSSNLPSLLHASLDPSRKIVHMVTRVFSHQTLVSSISFLPLIFIICNDFIIHHHPPLLHQSIHWNLTAHWVPFKQTVSLLYCVCLCACCLGVAACGVTLLSELPADSLLFFKLSSVEKPVLCIKGLFSVERSRGMLEDTALRWVCLGYQSQRLWSAAIIWSSAISPGSVHNQAARMRETFSLAGPLRPACNMGHLNKRFPIWSFLYS